VLDVLQAVEEFFPAEPCEKYYYITFSHLPRYKSICFDGLEVVRSEKKWAKAYSHLPFIFIMAQEIRNNYPPWEGEVVMRWYGRAEVQIETGEWEVRELSYEEAREIAKSINTKNGE
jgi:hypothetical protein